MDCSKLTTLRDLFIESTERYADNISFSYIDGDSYTYRQFRNKVDQVSEIFTHYGIGQGDKVALLSQNMPNWSVAYFSAIAFGRIIVPLLPDFSPDEIERIIEHSESKAMFMSKKLAYKVSEEVLRSLELVVDIETFSVIHSKVSPSNDYSIKSDTNTTQEADYREQSNFPKPEDLASIIYTSGTTGSSKGVMLTHHNLTAHLYSSTLLRPGYEWDVWLSLLPLSHTLESSLCMLLPMASGASVYYIERAPTPTILLQALKKVRPTTVLSVPLIIEKIYKGTIRPKFTSGGLVKVIYGTTLGRKLLHRLAGVQLKKTFGGRVRFFGIGGAKLDPIVERFLYEARYPYAIGYGLTECSPLLAGATPDIVKWQSTGPAAPGVTLKILNPNPATGEGEIVAKGENIMTGYYKNPEATAEVFTEDGWFRTKDLGILDKNGRLFIKGRLNNMIVGPSGENIYPEEIESVINEHIMVAESIVSVDLKGKLIARVYFNQEKLSEFREQLIKSYEEKKSTVMASYNETKENMEATMEEVKKALNEKIEQLQTEVSEYVNARVNKFSQISLVIAHPEQFEKTATLKIKRYLYI